MFMNVCIYIDVHTLHLRIIGLTQRGWHTLRSIVIFYALIITVNPANTNQVSSFIYRLYGRPSLKYV